ncbi:MAG: AI-2E family transporter [Rhodocyclales bacterium]|nr:AI-2E family transporter [Rhodocyclales bacterium]
MDSHDSAALTRRVILAVFFGGLLFLAYGVLAPFLVPMAWAGILAYVTWPLHRYLAGASRRRGVASALALTVLVAAAFILPVIGLVFSLRGEVAGAYQAIQERMARGPVLLPPAIADIPWLGEQLQEFLSRVTADQETLGAELKHWIEPWVGQVGQLAGGVTRFVAKLGLALLALFFFYLDGHRLVGQTRRVLERFIGERAHRYLKAVAETTKAVVYGIVLTALAQGALAGLAYWVAGVPAPVLLGALTALVALIPFGTPFVWGAVTLWLFFAGHTLAGFGMLAWGTFVVSGVDNLIRPLVISSATRIPFLLVMFGVLGGLAAFGVVGLFLGPVILAVLLAVWQEWLEEQTGEAGEI